MRTAFLLSLLEMAEEDERVWLLVGDLGYSVVEPFRDRFPSRFVNVGVAEQNMMGVAAGLALSGKVVFTYSIANFPILRCLEQIRNDVCYHNANVKIVSVGGGLAYGSLGVTHHATEDFAALSALPGMIVLAPGDPVEAALATKAIAALPGPCYLRLGKAGERSVHTTPPHFEVGKAILVRQGFDVTLLSTGSILPVLVEAARLLDHERISARVLSMPTLVPLDEAAIILAARETQGLFVVEEHRPVGGLGAAAAHALSMANGRRCHFDHLCLPPSFSGPIGSERYLREVAGLTAESIAARVREWRMTIDSASSR